MTRRFTRLAWSAALCTYLLIILGGIVRITGSGLGCGDHWPLCNGHLFPPLDDIGTVIEWSHRLVAALVSVLVVALAAYGWWLARERRFVNPGLSPGVRTPKAPLVAVTLLVLQILLGAITVKLELPAWTVILHLGTAMLLLATLLVIAVGAAPVRSRQSVSLLTLSLTTVLLGALTANLGAAAACHGFPLCNGQIWITAGPLAVIQWIHRLLAYSLAIVAAMWAWRTGGRAAFIVVGLVALQVSIGGGIVLLGLPTGLQVAHVAVGTAIWAMVVLALSLDQPAPAARSSEVHRVFDGHRTE
ncbi:MAG TPA: COX15/CtaA family protein [Gemmatimonadales bacterium]|nr:COX15/CtaA family protein [Gemmatimonadales bacterium]